MALLRTDQILFALSCFAVGLAAALIAGVSRKLIAAAILIPAVTISISYLVIEPFPNLLPIPQIRVSGASLAWFRLAGMTLLSIAWIRSVSVEDVARLANTTRAGQYLFSAALMTASAFRLAAARWKGLREMLCLQKAGLLRQRRKVGLGMAGPVGFQLTLASLVLTTDTALAAEGRGIGRRRLLAVRAQRPSIAGLALVVIAVGAAVLSSWANLDAWLQ